MTDYTKKLNKKIDDLYCHINNEKEYIMIYSNIEKDNKYKYVFILPDIINRNLQCGNYSRALRYYLIANQMMKKYDDDKNEIIRKITEYIISE